MLVYNHGFQKSTQKSKLGTQISQNLVIFLKDQTIK